MMIGLMTTRRFDGDEDVRSSTPDEVDTSTESIAGRPDTDAIADEGAERTDSGETTSSRDGTNRTGAVVVGGTVLGGATETVRRLGIDRHDEAGLAEQANIKARAKQVGGTGVHDGSSAFTPDGGIDGIIKTESGQEYIQSKHYGRPIGNSTLEQYDGVADVIGATNGTTESADPEGYGIDVVTAEDWPWRKRAKLEGKRVIRGCRRIFAKLEDRVRVVTSRVLNAARRAGQWLVVSGKRLCRHLVKIGSMIAKWFARRRLMTQIVLIVAVVGLLYLLWRWYTSREEEAMNSETDENTV